MRLFEIASAEEQMALLKLIMDKTWEALTTQQRQQAQQKATAKPKPAKLRSTKAPYAPQAPKLPAPNKPLQQAKARVPMKTLPQQNIQQAKVATAGKSMPAPLKASNDSKTRFSQQANAEIKNDSEGDDRHSKNEYKLL